MRVALDATPLTLSSGGLRRYVVELSRSLAESFPDDEYWLVSDQPFSLEEPNPPNLRVGPQPNGWLERRWWSWGLPRAVKHIRADLFHGTNFEVPYAGRTPAVLTLHDLSPWLNRAWHAHADRVRRRTPWLIRLRRACLILTHTEAVRRQAIERFGLAPERVIAVPLAAARCFRPAPGPIREPYFLFVGTLEPRKNVPFLVEVFAELRRVHPAELLLVGRRRPDFSGLPAADGIRWLGEISDDELAGLYSGAIAFVYPSLYEGFGLPVLEAMQCGAAVVASRDAAIQEVAGDAALLVDAHDVRAWVEALLALMERPDLRADYRERSLRRAAGFTWEKTAQRTHQAYVEALRQGRA
jgi:glycosyltransferase involved in cell wall biosynthesis